ncbi:MAG: hypothetical protein QOI94_1650 [Acidobacteriaceae bacterium]|nr:hypothetical protein [Acidobacteriaceae bacterium]
MLFEPFRSPKPGNRIFRRYALDGHGYICAKSLNSALIVRMRLSFFSRGVFVSELEMQQRLLRFLLPARQVGAYGAQPLPMLF